MTSVLSSNLAKASACSLGDTNLLRGGEAARGISYSHTPFWRSCQRNWSAVHGGVHSLQSSAFKRSAATGTTPKSENAVVCGWKGREPSTVSRQSGWSCRDSLRCQSSEKETATGTDDAAEDLFDLSLEDVVKDVVAKRLEEADATAAESGRHHHNNDNKTGSEIESRSDFHHHSGAEERSQSGDTGLKIDIAPKVLEALKGTGELEDKSLFDLVEEKRNKKLAEKASAASESDGLVNQIKDAFSRIGLAHWSRQGRAERKEGGAKRQGVNYRMDMDYVELPPVQVAVNELQEYIGEEDSSFPEFNEQVQDMFNLTGITAESADDPTMSTLVEKTTAFRTIAWLRECLTGVNGQTLETVPTPLAEQVLDLAILPGRRRVSSSDLEEAGLASVPGTVDAQQLQREVFRSGPFYAQWFERWRSGWVVTGYLDGDPAEVRARLQARLDQHFPDLKLVVFLLNTPQEVPWCLILPADEPVAFAFLPQFRQAAFASAVLSALVMWICKGIAIADPLLLNGEEAAIALAALPLGLLSILFTGSIARSAVASLYGVRDRFPIPLPMPGLGAIGMTAGLRGVLPSRAALIDIPLAGSLATAATSVAMITSSHSWLAWRFPQSGPLILVPPETLHHSFVLSYLVFQLQKASVVGPNDVIYMAIHPLAFAGLLGLNATALSLLPISKTDGGRITQGLFGREGHLLATGATFALVLVGFIFGDTALSVALFTYNWHDNLGEWYQKDEVSEVGFLRTLVAFVTMALGVIVLSPTFSWIPFHSLVKSANHVQTLLPTWGNL